MSAGGEPGTAAAMVVDLTIPARNEQANMGPLLAALPWTALRHVVVVDNGSTDGTAAAARAGGATVVHEPRPGYGSACLAGLAWLDRQARPPDAVAFLDADLADDPARLVDLCRPIAAGAADLVLGSRRRLAEPGALTSAQRFGNGLACLLIRLLLGRRYHDLGPMRVVRYASLRAMQMSDRTWGWTVEMQYKAAALGHRVLEVDVPYRCRRAGASKISGTWVGSMRAGLRILATIGHLWLAPGGWRGSAPAVGRHVR